MTLAVRIAWALAAAAAESSSASGATSPVRAEALDLASLVSEAERRNERSGIAKERIEQASAAVRRAVAQLLPSAELVGTYANRDQSARQGDAVFRAFNAVNGEFSASVRLIDASQFPAIASANSELEATKRDGDELMRSLRFETALAYYAVLVSEGAREAARERLELAEQTLKDVTGRFEAGLISRNEQSRTALEVASARLALTRTSNSVRQARLQLGFLVGRPVDEPLVADPFEVETSTLGLEETLDRRPDILALRSRIDAAESDALAPLLRLIPTIEAELQITASNETGFQDDPFTRILQLTATWVLYDGVIRYADHRENEALARERELLLSELQREVRRDVESAQAELGAAVAAVRQAGDALRVATINYEETTDRFEAGLATALEQADASVQRFEARVSVAEAEFARRQAALQLLRAVGRESPLPREG